MRQYLEIQLRDQVDPFDVQAYFKKYTTLKINVINNRSVRVWYNENRITSTQALKLITKAANEIKTAL